MSEDENIPEFIEDDLEAPVVPVSPVRLAEFDEAVLLHTQRIYNFIFKMVHNSEDAQDLTQETLMKAFRGWHRFEKGTNVKAWLLRIAWTTTINWIKRNRVSLSQEYQDIFSYPYDPSADPSQIYANKYLSSRLSESLLALPKDWRDAVILCDVKGYGYEKAAEILQIPVGTVKSRLFRSRGLLREVLEVVAPDIIQE